jgi:hypothetical protein
VGSVEGGKSQDLRRLHGGGRELHRHRELLHGRNEREIRGGVRLRGAGTIRHRHEVHPEHESRRPERRRKPPEEHGPVPRGEPQAPSDGLRRPVLGPRLGPDDPPGRDDAGARRHGTGGKDPVCGDLRRPRLGRLPGQHPGGPHGVERLRGTADSRPSGSFSRWRRPWTSRSLPGGSSGEEC